MSNALKVVVIGCTHAGTNAIMSLKKYSPSAEVVILQFHFFLAGSCLMFWVFQVQLYSFLLNTYRIAWLLNGSIGNLFYLN